MSIFDWLGIEVTWTFNIQWCNLMIKFDIYSNDIMTWHWALPSLAHIISQKRDGDRALLSSTNVVPVITPWLDKNLSISSFKYTLGLRI